MIMKRVRRSEEGGEGGVEEREGGEGGRRGREEREGGEGGRRGRWEDKARKPQKHPQDVTGLYQHFWSLS